MCHDTERWALNGSFLHLYLRFFCRIFLGLHSLISTTISPNCLNVPVLVRRNYRT